MLKINKLSVIRKMYASVTRCLKNKQLYVNNTNHISLNNDNRMAYHLHAQKPHQQQEENLCSYKALWKH